MVLFCISYSVHAIFCANGFGTASPAKYYHSIGQILLWGGPQAAAACKPECSGVPSWLRPVITPLQWLTWAKALESHPDRDFSAYIVEGLKDGFRLRFNYASHTCTSAKCNMLSAFQHPKVIDEYLEEETRLGRVIGPLDAQEVENIQISRFGVIPKPHKPGQ